MARHHDGAKDALLETALDLFTRHGYDAVGVQKIVDEAGLTKPTLYHYFGSKRGLLETICGDLETRLFETLGSALSYEGDLPGTLQALVDGVLRFAHRYPRETRLILALQHGPVASEARQIIWPVIERLGAAVRDIFTAAATDHGNMRGREYAYTAGFLGVCFTYAELLLDGHVEAAPDLAHRIMHQFSHGIYS